MRRQAFVIGAVLMGCGGTAIVDGDSGGAGSSGVGGTSSSSSSTSSGAGGEELDCPQLTAALDEALTAAVACDPCIDVPDPCTYPPGMGVTDSCGCPIPVNGLNQVTLQEVLDAYAQWTAAGCGPFECGQPCAISSNPTCKPTGSGCTGICSP